MGALVEMIPLKDWLYCGVILAILAAFGYYTVHERNIGKASEAAIVAKAAAAQAALSKEKSQHAQDNALSAEQLEIRITHLPPAADAPHLLVRQCPADGATVRPAGSASVSVPATESSVEHSSGVDIGPALDTIGRDSDAQVTYLQSLLKSCIDSGACKSIP